MMPSDPFVARIVARDVSSLALDLALALHASQTSRQPHLDAVVERALLKLQKRYAELMRHFDDDAAAIP